MWIYSPAKPSKPKVPETIKQDIETRAHTFVEAVLKPKHLAPEPKDKRFNYIVDIYTKWYRNYCYFCAKYCSPSPQAIAPFLRRNSPVWKRWQSAVSFILYATYRAMVGTLCRLSVDKCFEAIKDQPHFLP